MEARGTTLVEFIQGRRVFKIPLYQRAYNWKQEQCLTLFKDIENISKKDTNHFIGSIVFIQDISLPEYSIYSIIDGQQRLTTIMILLKALMDSSDDPALKEEIYDSLLTNKWVEDDLKIKLRLQKDDYIPYCKLLDNSFEIEDDKQIFANYNLFKNLLKSSKLDSKEIFRNIKRLNIVYVMISKEDENPQLIFESMNSTGLDLTQSDLIRNFLLMGLELKVQEKLYNKFWSKIEELLTNSKISDFIRDYLTLKTGKIPNKGNVYKEFKDFFFNLKDVKIESLLEELLTYAQYYSWFIYSDISNEKIKSKLLTISRLKSTVVYPFLLDLFYKFYELNSITEEELIETLNILLSYLIRRNICEFSTNILNKVFMTLAKEIENEDTHNLPKLVASKLVNKQGKALFPNDIILEDALKNRNNYKAETVKLFLEEIEYFNNNKERVDLNTTTLEHIMPQTLTPKWKNDLGSNFEVIHDKYLNNIGNLTLTGYNSELSNSSYQDKSEIYKVSNISITRTIPENYLKWTNEEITKRNETLIEEIKKIWPYPKNIIPQEKRNLNEEIDLFDEINFTGQKPRYLIINGTKYAVDSWKHLLKFFSDHMFEFDKETFYSLVKDEEFMGKNKRFIDTTKENMNSSIKIGENLFIESNRNANAIIEFCRKLLRKFENNTDEFSIQLRI